jgi:hypothetical protein
MLPSLNLDDLTYQQLVDILRAHLPGDEWSDHNPSDPGIALMELLAWLGEMDLYRMNRVPAAHQTKFLKLLVDPPVPVSVDVTLRLVPTPPPPPAPPPVVPPRPDLVIPAGLRVASDYRKGRRTVLESFTQATLTRPDYAGDLEMRAVHDLIEVPLGTSDGTPNQTFVIPDGPVLLDFASVVPGAPGYDPNPRVRVGAAEWELHPFLLTPDSQADPSPPPHFMIDAFEGDVRFGDGSFGAIPPAGAPITLIRCQILEGPAALIAEGDARHILNPQLITGLGAGESVTIAANTDAQGGENFFSADERMQRGLAEFRDPTRLITAGDFEHVATDDFNEFQQGFNAAVGWDPNRDLVTRAVALMNRKPPNLDLPAAGHVTLVILPAYDEAAFEAAPFSAPPPMVSKVALAAPSPGLTKRLPAFLEPRRLITTRLDVVGPELVQIAAQVGVVIESQRSTAQMATAVRAALRDYLSITSGYDDGRGWPLGRRVRRSQIFRVLEDVPGVDYVESLALSPANADGDIELGPLDLPAWDGDVTAPSSTALTVQVRRA